MMTTNDSCRMCKGKKLIKFLDLGKQPLANAFLRKKDLKNTEPKFPLEAYFCADCNLAQLIHVADKGVLFSDYIYFSSGMPKLSDHFKSYAEDIMARFLKQDELVVELGSNDGILLKFFKEKGFKVLGIDPAKNIAKVAEKGGVPTIADFFSESLAEKISKERGTAKAIIGNNVVAHINDHHDLCRGVKKLLARDGVFVFEAPYLEDMFNNLTFDTIYHEHLSFLAIRPLAQLMNQFGLEIFEVKIVPAQGKSIRVFVGHRGVHEIKPSVKACIAKELSLGLNKIFAYKKLAARVVAARRKVRSAILKFKRAGRTIAAYGAPAKGNTVLNFYGIGKNELAFALDDLPSKQNLYTPGTHVKVISREEAVRKKPDCYLLLAWNYLPIIIQKEKAFLENGGVFVLPNGEIINKSSLPKRI